GKCRTFEEAVEALLRGVKPENLLELDQKLQTGIRRQFKSLLQVCLAANDAFKDLRETICQQAEAILETQMGKASIAATYLQEQGSDEDILADVGSAFDEATPPLAGPR